MRGTSASPGASSTTFSTASSPDASSRYVCRCVTTPGARWTTSIAARADAAGLERQLQPVEPELEPARQDAEVALLVDEPQAVVVGRRAPELQPRPGDEHVAAVGATARRGRRSRGRRRRACRRLRGRRRGSAASRAARARRGFVDGRPSCCQATSCPAGAHSVASRRKKRNVIVALARRRRGSLSATSSVCARRDAQRRQLAAGTPLAVDGQLPLAAVAVEAREEVPVADAEAAAAERLDADRLRRGTSARSARGGGCGRARRCRRRRSSRRAEPRRSRRRRPSTRGRGGRPGGCRGRSTPRRSRPAAPGGGRTRRSSRRGRRSSCPSRASTRT